MTAVVEDKTVTGTLHAMDHTGDTRFMWDKDKPEEVAAAKAQFDTLKRKNYLAYTVNADGSQGEVIREFDPEAQAIIMSPQLVGG